MRPSGFDRDALLDLSVNIIPLVIMLFFIGLFLVITPFGLDLDATAIQLALMVGPLALLAVLTYYAGKVIIRDEAKLDGPAGEYATVVGTEADDEPATDTTHPTDEERARASDDDGADRSAGQPQDQPATPEPDADEAT